MARWPALRSKPSAICPGAVTWAQVPANWVRVTEHWDPWAGDGRRWSAWTLIYMNVTITIIITISIITIVIITIIITIIITTIIITVASVLAPHSLPLLCYAVLLLHCF